MQVNSIQTSKVGFGQNTAKANIEAARAFAQMDNRTLSQIAYKEAQINTNSKKHKRINSALMASVPLAAGLGAAASIPQLPGKLAKFTKLFKLSAFAGNTIKWIGAFALIDAVFAGKRLLDKKSKKSREFTNKHPLASSLATIGASVGVLELARRGLGKYVAKAAEKPVTLSAKKALINMAESINRSKVYNFIPNIIGKAKQGIKALANSKNSKILTKTIEAAAKAKPVLKSITKTSLALAPLALMFTAIAHSINHKSVLNAETARVYTELKDSQNEVKESLAKAELV